MSFFILSVVKRSQNEYLWFMKNKDNSQFDHNAYKALLADFNRLKQDYARLQRERDDLRQRYDRLLETSGGESFRGRWQD